MNNKAYNNPPEEIEAFEDTRELSPEKTEEALVKDILMKASERHDYKARPLTEGEEHQIASIKRDYNNSFSDTIPAIMANKPKGDESWKNTPPPQTTPSHKSGSRLRNFITAAGVGFASLFGGGKATAQGNEVRVPQEAFAKARLVKEKPAGYAEAGEKGGRTFYYTQEAGSKKKDLAEATPGGEKGGEKYEAFLKEQLASGISPEELAEKKYISPSQIEKYKSFYKESLDVVYIEKNKEVKESDPYAAYAKNGEVIYTPGAGGYLTAELCYPVRDSKNINDGGMLNTQHVDGLLRFRKKDVAGDAAFTGEVVLLTEDEIKLVFGGTNHFKNEELLKSLKARAQKISSSEKK